VNDVLLIGSESLGNGDDQLGQLLMGNMLRIMGDKPVLPKYVILWNSGVKIATPRSGAMVHLKNLADKGVTVISCGTCVEFFDLADEMAVGEVDGMSRILDILQSHDVLTV
jgi:hypothetical protein